jgi:anaerobic ribonucleoside-triphosphate reductase activating protein
MDVQIAFSIPNTEAEGPGSRFALWTQGCTLGCPGCCNPEMWRAQGGQSESVEALFAQIYAVRDSIEGVSFLGGEPFEQDSALALLALKIKEISLNIMVFSGFTLEEIGARDSALLPYVDLLVAGRYVKESRTTKRRWIGSKNQSLHFLSAEFSEDDPRFSEPNHAEILLNSKGDLTVVGFPFDSVMKAFPKEIKKTDV